MSRISRVIPRRRPGRLAAAVLALVVPALLAAAPAPRGHPASRIGTGGSASEYWDLVARFDSGHKLFARFLITNQGPGEKTGVANGHFVEPDGTVWDWHNGRSQKNWQLGPEGLRLEVGSSELDLRADEFRLRVHKRKKGVDIDLRFTPANRPAWDTNADPAAPSVDVLAHSAPIRGSVWFRGMAEPVELTGRAGLSHTWMEAREGDIALRQLDFFSLGDEVAIHLRDFVAPDGTRSGWLRVLRAGEILFESSDFAVSFSGRSAAEDAADYPIPETLVLRGASIQGHITLKAGLVHHDPLDEIPQPFRFLLSLSMRPHRVWAESPFAVTVGSGSDELKIRGTGITIVTYLNPPPPPQLR
jgi:hypothetical protein